MTIRCFLSVVSGAYPLGSKQTISCYIIVGSIHVRTGDGHLQVHVLAALDIKHWQPNKELHGPDGCL